MRSSPFSPYRIHPMNSRKCVSSTRAVLASQFPTIMSLWIACRHPFASLVENSQNAKFGLKMGVISGKNRPGVSEVFTVVPTPVPLLPSGAAGAQQAQPASPHSLAPLAMPRRRWTPIYSSPTVWRVRTSLGLFLLRLTLSVVWSPLPKKSLRASEARPVKSRHDRSSTPDGCFSVVRA
jgi:hypothetical protein